MVHRPIHPRPKPPKSKDYLLDLSLLLTKMMNEQNVTIQDIEKALKVIELSRN